MYDIKIESAGSEGFARIIFCVSKTTEQAVMIKNEDDMSKLHYEIHMFLNPSTKKDGE